MVSDETPTRTHMGTVATYGGLTALALGGLYALGALLKAGQVRDAGVSARDALPLFPLEQLLATGIAAIFDNFIPLLIVTVVVVALIYGLRVVQPRADAARARRLAEIADVSARHDALVEQSAELLRQLNDVTPEEAHVTPEEAKRLHGNLRAIALERDQIHRAFDAMALEQDRLLVDVDRLTKEVDLERTKFLKYRRIAILFATIVVVVTLFIATPALAIGYLIVVAASLLMIRFAVPVHPWFVLVAVGIIFAAVLVGAFVAPRALPIASLTRVDGTITTGKLVADTGDQWHIITADRHIVTIEADTLRTATIVTPERTRSKSVYDYIFP